jgi:xylulokinase
MTLVPYLEGERTPDRPRATGALHGLTLANAGPAQVARAAVEGLLCGLADGLDALVAQGARASRLLLIGGGAASEAVRRIAPQVLGRPVVVPASGEYVALGAARQAAWVLAQSPEPPAWSTESVEVYDADPVESIRERYAEARDHVLERPAP